MKKTSIFSTNTNISYSFLLPITCLFWKRITDYEPFCFLVGNQEEWLENSINKYILNSCPNLRYLYIKNIEEIQSSTVSQVSRLFYSCISNEEEYILTSDIDMFPLDRSWFNQFDLNYDFNIFFANANNHERYPICYLGGKTNIWKNIMNIENENINQYIENYILKNINKNTGQKEVWEFDETLFVNQIKKWNGYSNKCQFIERKTTPDGPPFGRVDRYNWIKSLYQNEYVDAHIFRNAWEDENWVNVNQLLHKFLTKEDIDFCNDYKNKFKELL